MHIIKSNTITYTHTPTHKSKFDCILFGKYSQVHSYKVAFQKPASRNSNNYNNSSSSNNYNNNNNSQFNKHS